MTFLSKAMLMLASAATLAISLPASAHQVRPGAGRAYYGDNREGHYSRDRDDRGHGRHHARRHHRYHNDYDNDRRYGRGHDDRGYDSRGYDNRGHDGRSYGRDRDNRR